MRLYLLARLLFLFGLNLDSSKAYLAHPRDGLTEDATKIAALESRLGSLEKTVAELQSTQTRLLAALSSQAKVELESIASPNAQSEAQKATSKRDDSGRGKSKRDERFSVCVAVPCIPRHLSSLRDVLLDIRLQTVLPQEVVVSLSETETSEYSLLIRVDIVIIHRRLTCVHLHLAFSEFYRSSYDISHTRKDGLARSPTRVMVVQATVFG